MAKLEEGDKLKLVDGKLMIEFDPEKNQKKLKGIIEAFTRLMKGEIRSFTVYRDGPIQEKR